MGFKQRSIGSFPTFKYPKVHHHYCLPNPAPTITAKAPEMLKSLVYNTKC